MYKISVVFVFIINVPFHLQVELDLIDCGIDNQLEVTQGDVEISEYPWLGILYYTYQGDVGETRSVTTVALIHKEFVIAAAADIGPMPKRDFRRNSRVLLGEDWNRIGRRVRSYVLHPEYGAGATLNTVALVQLKDPVRHNQIRPLCAPPETLRNPVFYVVKFDSEYNELKQKQVIPMSYVPSDLCWEFYVRANLYSRKMRPTHVACAVALDDDEPCVWDAGAALVSRDSWGRWLLLGLGVRGPGCGAPARFLDAASYYPWVQRALAEFNQITISKMSKHKYVLRSGSAYQRFGACDPEEKTNMVYRELILLETDNGQFQFLTYNMSILDNIEYTCLTLELTNATATSEMRINHVCPRKADKRPCHVYRGSKFDISVYIMFSDKCMFEMYTWGFNKNMTLIDPQEWKWEEGTYYEDFTVMRVEYRGQAYMTEFGYEPLDDKVWVPEYDVWTTTQFDNSSWSSTTPLPEKDQEQEEGDAPKSYIYIPTENTATTTTTTSTTTKTHTRRYFRIRTRSASTSSSTASSTTTTEPNIDLRKTPAIVLF